MDGGSRFEYGRDRWAFQHAENLFSPTLSTIELPIENYYVRKMQATFAFMDWLSLKLKTHFSAQWMVDIWKILSAPDPKNTSQKEAICQLIRAILTDETSRNELAFYLRRALDLYEPREVNSLLWDQPRSLLFEVLPTVLPATGE